MCSLPRALASEYLIAENCAKISDDNFLFSLRVAMSNPPDDHFSYGCFPRPRTPRRSPASGGNNNNNNNARRGLFHIGQGGRTVLPPLHLPFRTSRSPAPDPSFSSNQYLQQEPTQSRSDYNISAYGQSGWPVNPIPGHHQPTSFPTDPRFQAAQTSYGTYPSRTSSAMIADTHDSRSMPPLSDPMQGFPAAYTPYPEHSQQPTASYYPPAPDPRNLPPPVPSTGFESSGMMPRRASMSVDRTVPSRLSMHGPSPYPRNPPMVSPSAYVPEPPVAEPAIKKKRKRADAEQLKVLNETYNRTAFPSTEERAELAKKLGMSARSVQIWFQNKRQAMRQSTRQASSSAPPTTSEPFPASSHTAGPASLPAAGGYVPMGSASVSQAYGLQRPVGETQHHVAGRLIPSPTPSTYHRGRSHDDDERDPRRYQGRPY
ncbi:hypothetical protein AcW1_009031 [Taiwanofungus camphoratus]|nr:hypothetical protein AcW1_009031 [Antrodia cinnamomea]